MERFALNTAQRTRRSGFLRANPAAVALTQAAGIRFFRPEGQFIFPDQMAFQDPVIQKVPG